MIPVIKKLSNKLKMNSRLKLNKLNLSKMRIADSKKKLRVLGRKLKRNWSKLDSVSKLKSKRKTLIWKF